MSHVASLAHHQVDIAVISEDALLLSWPEKVCPVQHQWIVRCQQALSLALKDVITDSVISFHTLAIYCHITAPFTQQLHHQIKHIIDIQYSETNPALLANQCIEIPVYYGEEAGWDLPDVAKQCQLTTDDVINKHCAQSYRAYALGFTPGFCYLASLPTSLQIPRKSTPRVSVPAGAVAIAEKQTAVYPSSSPGGWHIIGQTPKPMVQYHQQGVDTAIHIGDSVTFKAINLATFIELGGVVCQALKAKNNS